MQFGVTLGAPGVGDVLKCVGERVNGELLRHQREDEVLRHQIGAAGRGRGLWAGVDQNVVVAPERLQIAHRGEETFVGVVEDVLARDCRVDILQGA